MEDRCQLLREGGFTNFFISMCVALARAFGPGMLEKADDADCLFI